MSSPKQVSDLLKSHGLRAQKRLGQNFLCDRNTLDRIIGVANLTPNDAVVEIGGGLGALTLALADISLSVTTFEIDLNLEPLLRSVVADKHNVNLLFEDFLRTDVNGLFESVFGSKPGTVVANIPYYITTSILETLLENRRYLKRIVLLVQREFAERMAAPAGSDECGALSLYAQFHATVQLHGPVPPTVFLPSPGVTSEIVSLSPVRHGTVPVGDEGRMFSLIRAGFGQRRKTLINALMRAPASFGLGFGMDSRREIEQLLARAGIDGSRRGETLSLAEYARISDSIEAC